MQKIIEFCHMTVDCEPSQNEEFGDLKAMLSEMMREIKDFVAIHRENADGATSVKIDENTYFSIYADKNDYYLGIDRITNENGHISHHISRNNHLDDFINVNEKRLGQLEERAKRIIGNNLAPLKDENLVEAWRDNIEHDRDISGYDVQKGHEERNKLMWELYKKDPISFEHSVRVGTLVGEYYERQGFLPEQVDEYRDGAILHDIGKLSIPDEVLKKPGKLDSQEFSVIKTHASNGLEFLTENLAKSQIIKDTIEHHHEAYGGSRGYPNKELSGEDIPMAARVCAVFDVYDALSSKRQYKEAMPQAEVFSLMRQDEKLDQRIVVEAIEVIREYEKSKETISHDIATKDRPEEIKVSLTSRSIDENMNLARQESFMKKKEREHTAPSLKQNRDEASL